MHKYLSPDDGGGAPPAEETFNASPIMAALFESIETPPEAANKPADKPKPGDAAPPPPPPKEDEDSSYMVGIADFVDAPADAAGADKAKGAEKPGDKPADKAGDKAKPADATPPAEGGKKTIPVKMQRQRAAAAAPAAEPAPPATATPPATAKPGESDDDLLDDERDQLELAEYLERAGDQRYSGVATKLRKFFKAHKEFVEKLLEKDPDAVVDESNPDYKKFLAANKPAFPSPREERRLRDKMIEERVLAQSNQRISSELKKRDAAPVVKQRADAFFDRLVASGLPEDVAKAIQEQGMEAASAEHAFELKFFRREFSKQANLVEDYYSLINEVTPYDPNNGGHRDVVKFVNDICSDFAANGGKYLIQDGKTFVTRSQWSRLPAADRAKHWTFTHDQIEKAMELTAVKRAKENYEKALREREAEGFERKPRKAASAPPRPGEDDEPPPPAARVTSTPAADATPPGESKLPTPMSVLGY